MNKRVGEDEGEVEVEVVVGDVGDVGDVEAEAEATGTSHQMTMLWTGSGKGSDG